jgi:hypothetical protein
MFETMYCFYYVYVIHICILNVPFQSDCYLGLCVMCVSAEILNHFLFQSILNLNVFFHSVLLTEHTCIVSCTTHVSQLLF